MIEVPQGLYLVPLFLFTFHQQIESPERTDLQDISAILSNACEEMIKEETLGLQFVLYSMFWECPIKKEKKKKIIFTKLDPNLVIWRGSNGVISATKSISSVLV